MVLKIRRFEESDLQSLYELLSDEEVMRYIEPPFSLEQTKIFLDTAALTDNPLVYAVDVENGVFIGYVIYHDYKDDSKEIGWVLKRSVWGKGYAKELTRLLTARANSERKSIVIECVPEQHVTKHIAELSHFSYMGKDGRCDVYKYESRTEESSTVLGEPLSADRKGILLGLYGNNF